MGLLQTRWLALGIALATVVPSSALAEVVADTPSVDKGERTSEAEADPVVAEAARLFEQATQELAKGHAAIGRDLLRRSLVLYSRVPTRYNLGVALRRTGETTEAVATFEGLSRESSLNPQQLGAVTNQLKLARDELATLEITVTGVEQATIELDGREIGTAVATEQFGFQLDAGDHVVLARGGGTGQQNLTIGRGETQRITLHVIPDPQREADKKKRKRRIAWFTTAGALVVAGVIAGVVLATQSDSTNPLDSGDTPPIGTP